jgi:hypothetical protein
MENESTIRKTKHVQLIPENKIHLTKQTKLKLDKNISTIIKILNDVLS